MPAVFPLRLTRLLLVAALAFAQSPVEKPVSVTLCEIVKRAGEFNGKLVEIRSLVESGVDDLPAGLTDESCGADVKFFTPDDPQFGRLLKSREFRKLTKDVKKNPLVEATVTGWFKRAGTEQKPEYGIALDRVQNVTVKSMPHAPRQKVKSDSSLQ